VFAITALFQDKIILKSVDYSFIFTVFLSRFGTFLESSTKCAKQAMHFSKQFVQIAKPQWIFC